MTQFKYPSFVVPSKSKDAPKDYEDRWEATFGKCKVCNSKPHKLDCDKNPDQQLSLPIEIEVDDV